MTESLLRALGDELRRARKRRRWTRQDFHARLGWDVSLQTLATYELGTRTLSVVRLVDLAEALGESPLRLLGRALERAGRVTNRMDVDLRQVVNDQTAELAPLRRWARVRLRQIPPGYTTTVLLDGPAIVALAELCGLGVGVLAVELRRYSVSAPVKASEQ